MTEARLLVMPKLGLTMTEGVVAKWEKAAGERFAAGDVLVIIETDKTTHEVEAPNPGVLGRIKVGESQTVEVGTVLADWTLDDERGLASATRDTVAAVSAQSIPLPSRATDRASPSDGASSLQRKHASPTQRLLVTPYARQVAREGAIDLRRVRGSGPRGRIHGRDVEEAANAPFPVPAQSERVPVSQVVISADIDVTRLVEVLQSLNRADEGPNVALDHVLVASALRVLRALPVFDVAHEEGSAHSGATALVRVVVASAEGEAVRVFDPFEAMPFGRLAARLDGREDTQATETAAAACVFTIWNVAARGIRYMTATLQEGQYASIAFGAVQERLVRGVSSAFAVIREVGLMLSFDERAIERQAALKLLDDLRAVLARPLSIVLG